MARVTRTSILTGRTRTLELKRYDQDEFERLMHSVEKGDVPFEDAFPDISQEAKDFIVYGTTKAEWEDKNYGGERGEIPLVYDTPDNKKG